MKKTLAKIGAIISVTIVSSAILTLLFILMPLALTEEVDITYTESLIYHFFGYLFIIYLGWSCYYEFR